MSDTEKIIRLIGEEIRYMIVIAKLSDWLQRLAPVFQPMRSKTKTKTNRTMYTGFLPCFEQVTGNCKDCDWFIGLSAPVVIGRSNCFGFGFSTVI